MTRKTAIETVKIPLLFCDDFGTMWTITNRMITYSYV